MPPAICPHCEKPCADGTPTCPACGRPIVPTDDPQKARGWWSIRLEAPFWAGVSALLVVLGLVVVGQDDPKGRAVLVAVGAFGLLCSLTMLIGRRIRARRDAP